ncbi:unnamed protein product [Symbiodinium necroappetens]|uniref:TPM domain-containing protein n=1 Tax=Symbiodinium necroappetens TaxID=1628268 RepID=A0A812KFR6_9DINO|nr:unnamed protein product [Symbiodinium necroappetens]
MGPSRRAEPAAGWFRAAFRRLVGRPQRVIGAIVAIVWICTGACYGLPFSIPRACRRASVFSLVLTSGGQAQAVLPQLPPSGSRVLDLGGLLPASLEQDLEKAIESLERDTPYRFRLVCPPPGYGPQDRATWSDFVKHVGQYFAQEAQWDPANAVVLLVSPRTSAGRTANPLNFSVATKLTQRLQYRIASDTFTKISNKYGDRDFVMQTGEGEAAALAAFNAIACLRKGVCMQPLPDDEARSVAFGSKAAVSTADALEAAGIR